MGITYNTRWVICTPETLKNWQLAANVYSSLESAKRARKPGMMIIEGQVRLETGHSPRFFGAGDVVVAAED